MKWIKRIGLGILALVAIVAGVGAAYEMRARGQAATEFPAPGKLVDIGGRRIEIDCRGSGSPTVILESGLDMNGPLSWALVHDSIAATTRTCGYSRAGVMWSDDKSGPHNAVTIAADLKATLEASHEQGPYVMVGHSLGGPYIMTFTKRYPAEVAGLVFVDASHPEQVQRFKALPSAATNPSLMPYKVAAAFAWTGLIRAAMPRDRGNKIPKPVQAAMNAYAPTSLGPMLAESDGMTATMEEAGTFRQLGDRPVVVLTAMAPMDTNAMKTLKMDSAAAAQFQGLWKTMHDDEASWSSRSEHILVPDATHYIQVDRPDIVIAAVRRVVGMVRTPPVVGDSLR
jgi:pimeloyl-ACP methyl ester carboxylesterase